MKNEGRQIEPLTRSRGGDLQQNVEKVDKLVRVGCSTSFACDEESCRLSFRRVGNICRSGLRQKIREEEGREDAGFYFYTPNRLLLAIDIGLEKGGR